MEMNAKWTVPWKLLWNIVEKSSSPISVIGDVKKNIRNTYALFFCETVLHFWLLFFSVAVCVLLEYDFFLYRYKLDGHNMTMVICQFFKAVDWIIGFNCLCWTSWRFDDDNDDDDDDDDNDDDGSDGGSDNSRHLWGPHCREITAGSSI